MQEFVESVTALDIVKERLNGNPSANKDRRAPKNVWVTVNDDGFGSHD